MNRDEFQHALWDVNDHYEQGKTSQKAEANILACYDEQRAEIERLQDESEQLRMAVGLAATIKSDMEMRCDDPVGMMQEVHAYTAQLQAQLAGWKELEGKDIYQQYTDCRARVQQLQAQLATAKGELEHWTHDSFKQRETALREALQGILDIGKRDMSNPKYDRYFETAREAMKEPA